MLFGLKTFFKNSLERVGGKKKESLNQVKRAASLLKKGDVSLLCPCSAGGDGGKRKVQTRKIKRLVVFAEAVSSGFSDSLDCIYNIWPCTEP